MNKKLTYASIATLLLPAIAFAEKKDLNYLIGLIAGYLNKILLLLMGFAVVFFVYYVIQYFIRPTEKRAEGAQYVMWSVIGFFIILSFWGIVYVLQNTFQLDNTKPGSWTEFFNIFPK